MSEYASFSSRRINFPYIFCREAFELMQMDTSKDSLERRCPRLGGPVSFKYCMLNGENSLPCWKIFDCWWEIFDVLTYLKQNLSEERFNTLINTRPQPKITSIIDLIQRAKKTSG